MTVKKVTFCKLNFIFFDEKSKWQEKKLALTSLYYLSRQI